MIVTEIFASLQGEGERQGCPCIFLRLSGCNLHCSWCDTLYSQNASSGKNMNLDEILNTIINYNIPYVCVTGGEPLLQKKDLIPLLKALHEKGFCVDIETNGTISFDECIPYASICMDIKCPSSGETSELTLLKSLQKTDAVKFVVGNKEDYMYMINILKDIPPLLKSKIYVTPVFGTDTKWLIDNIISDRLSVRFQVQLHKVVNIQ